MKNLTIDPTSTKTLIDNAKSIDYKMGEYSIKVLVNERNEFIGIENLSVDKTFYTSNFVKTEHDVEKYYKD